ncbi:MAG: T9SS type A sorting domain-containing protein, partial [Bacteroidia bacterium]|nr:T9SS type A sorting domain-containing protein [Bacteroidia bacterium]
DAVGSGDLCIRCHSPVGWLEGRSTPTDGSALVGDDFEGVQCHFCHKLVDPQSTEPIDLAYMSNLTNVPTQSGNGSFVVDSEDIRRGPYDNVQANHDTHYSPFHSESKLCATCHDTSNPVFTLAPDGTYQPNSLGAASPTFETYEMFPVERTFSEWKMSAYNTPAGIPSTVFGGNKANVSSCQDCHMKDVTGKGCDKNFAPIRNDLPLHDMTGGNTFIPLLIKQQFGTEVDGDAIDAGIIRARGMLTNAATMTVNAMQEQDGYEVYVEIINETGHKLPSGYPEGRRMWINLRAYDIDDNLIYESGAYNAVTADLNTDGAKIYEAKLGMSEAVAAAANANGNPIYSAGESFHFALNNVRIKDNRIPPRGFTNANFEAVQAEPVGYSYPDGAYSDVTEYSVPTETERINVRLLYQTVSKEYIEFLRDANTTDDKGQVMYDLWAANGKSTPEVMNEEDFFTGTLSTSSVEPVEELIKVYPNPANEAVTINLNLNQLSDVSIELYSMTGAKVETVYKGDVAQGSRNINWQAGHLAAGTYIMKFNFERQSVSKLIIIR